MSSKPVELPSLDEDLTPNLRRLPPRQIPDDVVQANSRTLGEQWGASTRIHAPPPTTPLESLRLDLPEYLVRALRVKCAEEKVTNAYLVMKALANDGWHIEAFDLVRDRYKRRNR
jgi:hypothetical protein